MKFTKSKFDIRWLLICSFIYLNISCQPIEGDRQTTTFDAKALTSENLKAREFGLSDHLLSPFRAKILDSILLVSDYGGNPLLVAYDLKKNTLIKKFGKKGRGPGEFLSAWNLTIAKSDTIFSVYDPILKKMVQFTFKDRVPTFTDEIQLKNEEFFIYANWLTSSKIAYTSFSPKGRLVIYDINNQNISFFPNSTPANTKGVPKSVHSHSYHASVESVSSGKKLAVCSRYADQIELYQADGKKLTTIVGPEGFTPIYNIVDNNGTPSMAESGKTKLAYLDIACTENFIYALYSGKNHEEYPGLSIEHGQQIYVFDWKGNPIKVYQLDRGITSMAISKDQKYFYGTSLMYNKLVDVLYFEI